MTAHSCTTADARMHPARLHNFLVPGPSPFKLCPGSYAAVFVGISVRPPGLLSAPQELQRSEDPLPQMSVSYGFVCQVAFGVSAAKSCLVAIECRGRYVTRLYGTFISLTDKSEKRNGRVPGVACCPKAHKDPIAHPVCDFVGFDVF